ncbi:TIGR02444 family protein [Halomonas sp. YLGW01]|uniref:TIGR02444 family protein n=1 Tax=Halomonas sp. YLGW01 TaxID=2773308 RepID=UPI00177CE3D1|nr:TIGR02444 family protein [Halomonas sp. YLGW01]
MNSTELRRHLRAPNGHDDATPPWRLSLWDFALAFYARPGIEAACLTLQDGAGLDVNALLWACWLDAHDLTPEAELANDDHPLWTELRAWQREITLPLRRQRRALKKQALANPAIAELRETIKHAELLSEREALARLEAIASAGQGIRPLGEGDPGLARRLGAWLPAPTFPHLRALCRLQARLDPPTPSD